MMDDNTHEPLAIVGIGCRLPGDVRSADDLWKLLCDGTDATCDVPKSRWHAARFHDPNASKVGKIITRRGGFLAEIDQFDPQFFGISPREAHSLDPQQRLLLQTAWEALEDAGIPADQLAGTDVGVFVGGFTLDYQLLQNQGRTSRYRFKAHSATGMMMTMLANRISHAFDLRGPSMSVDTACSSSLVAVHLAAQSIWSGDCQLALVGGVNVMVGPNTAIAESKSGFLSPDGRSKAFDDSADGYARGEGGAVVVLKPLAHALRDGDDIYAQILGTAVSQDGHTDGITVPREDAQHAAIRTALQRADIEPNDVGYVEAHGTGTPLGDPIEIRALAAALTAERSSINPLVIGSVKTNIGHLEAGAGVAGLIKAALVAKHGYIPATVHFQTPSRHVSLADLNIEISGEGRPFPVCERRVVGVNSFGFGGTNAHVVLAEAPVSQAESRPEPAGTAGLTLLPISARSEDALAAAARQLAGYLDAHPDAELGSLAYTLGLRRAHLSHRHTVLADSIDEVRQQLHALADGGQVITARTAATAPKLAFVCTGMGPQWWRMCRGLLAAYPVFADSIARTDRELARHADWSLLEELQRDEDTSRMAETQIAQPANFAIQIALAEQLAQFGITPDAVIGHSAGEVAAHYLAGLLSFERAVEVIYHRSRLQQRTSGQGRMLAVGADQDALLTALTGDIRAEIGGRVSVAAVNSPSAITLAGDGEILEDIARQLDAAGVFNRLLAGNVPYHTHYMETVKDDLLSALDGLSSQHATLPLYSTVTGASLERYDAGAAYWWQNTRATVLFEPALRQMIDDGYTHFLELGPHPVLAASIFETAGTHRVSAFAAQRRQEDDVRTLLGCVGELHCGGRDISWDAVNLGESAALLKLPSYPWQSRRYWNDTQEATELLFYNPVHPLLGQEVSAIHPTWEAEVSTVLNPFLADHRVQGSVVVPGAVYIEMGLAAARETYGSKHSVNNLVLHRAVILDDTCDPILRTTLNEGDGTLEFAAFTANADGDLKWVITATAELNMIPAAPIRRDSSSGEAVTSLDGDDFYTRTEALGFDYGGAFRSIAAVTAGHDWAVAELNIPPTLLDELDDYDFHPALIDGAFQTLFGAPFLGQQEGSDPFLPTRVRRCAVYGRPEEHMTVRADVVLATAERIECDLVISDPLGRPLVVIDGFTVQSLATSSRMSPERIDKGILEIQWCAMDSDSRDEREPYADERSWLILDDDLGVGDLLAQELRRNGQRARTVRHQSVEMLTEADHGWLMNPQRPEQMTQLITAHLDNERDLAGIINCWPLDIAGPDSGGHLGAFTMLRLVKTLAENDTVKPLMYFITSNSQPTPGSAARNVDQAAIWGLGRVIGHQELAEYWGGLIDIDTSDNTAETVARICGHVLDDESEDQIAIRSATTYVPRLRPCAGLTNPFPTKLAADATYVVTGGAGALGRIAATYLAERGARHLTLLGRSRFPQRDQWSALRDDDPHRPTVDTIRTIEQLGATVTVRSVDITDADQIDAWLADHDRHGGRPIRGIIHAAGSVHDQLLVNMSEDDYAAVVRPKITGTTLLHNAFRDSLDFFVMFGSAGSTIASPGQGNYAAANAFLDAFAHHRRAQGLPALTIGWGPWSIGMVEELGLEKMYAQRGIDLITPAVGVRILDRLMNQDVAAVVAISADWNRARQAGLGAHLPLMFSDLQSSDQENVGADDGSSVLNILASTPESDRLAVVGGLIRTLVAAVFDCGEDDFASDALLEDIGLDSMMAMEFRVRINMTFSIDLPVLEILKGVSVNSLSERILAELHAIHGHAEASTETEPMPTAGDEEVDRLMESLSDAELLELLGELEPEVEGGLGEANP